MTNAADNNRVKTADWRARMEMKLDAVYQAVEKLDTRHDAQLKAHSQRLDSLTLAVAEQEQARRERDRLRQDVDALKKEQRWWTGITSVLAALGNVDIGALFGR